MSSIIHNDGKKDPELEIAEYFVQIRESDINDFDLDRPIVVNVGEHDLIQSIYLEDKEKFRKILKEGIVWALLHYNYNETDEEWETYKESVRYDISPIIILPVNIKLHDN